MAVPKHTPGPWVADAATGGAIFGPTGQPIMTAGPEALDDDGTGWANALLIAAAPRLLAELWRLRNLAANRQQATSADLDVADEALAQAEGRA